MKPYLPALLLSVFGPMLSSCAVDLTPELPPEAEPEGNEPPSQSPGQTSGDGAPITETANKQGTNNDYFYTFWKDGGSVTMTLPGQPMSAGDHAGNYAVSWVSGNYNFVGGKGWSVGSSTRTVNYDCSAWSTGSSNAYLALYGWSTDPLVEYYVVESWGSWRPPGATASGQVTSDGSTYDLYRARRENAPNITGTNADFDQFWSVRTTKRAAPTGVVVITFANHRDAWAAQGWNLGAHDYQVLATEVFNPASSGSSNCTVW